MKENSFKTKNTEYIVNNKENSFKLNSYNSLQIQKYPDQNVSKTTTTPVRQPPLLPPHFI